MARAGYLRSFAWTRLSRAPAAATLIALCAGSWAMSSMSRGRRAATPPPAAVPSSVRRSSGTIRVLGHAQR